MAGPGETSRKIRDDQTIACLYASRFGGTPDGFQERQKAHPKDSDLRRTLLPKYLGWGLATRL